MRAIYKKELSQYLNGPGFVIFGIFILFFSALFCYTNLFAFTSSDISYTFSYMIYAMMVLIPLFTMRLFAEERAHKTDQLLYTAPIKASSIVMGKYLAAMTLVLISVLFTLIHVAVLVSLGNPYPGQVFSCYLGFLLYCAVYVAIGLFISSCASSQIVSGVLTFTVFIGLIAVEFFVVPAIASPTLYNILSSISFASRFSEFSMGIINISSVVYYLSIAFLFLFFTERGLERRRWA